MPIKDIDKRKEYFKNYYENNKESLLKKSKENPNKKSNNKKYHLKNKEGNNERSKKWNTDNKEYKKELDKIYYQENKKSINSSRNEYQKERKKSDKLFNLKCVVRSLISNSLNRNGYSKSSKTFEILGCSFEEFKLHIESKFESWMTWDNYGLYNGDLNYGWDIDHIIPISSAKDEDEILRLNSYTNLQPLCSKINRDIKINKTENAYY